MQYVYNEMRTNQDGYRDTTAGQAVRNIMSPPRRSDCRTEGWKRPDPALMAVRAFFGILRNVCALQGLSIKDITLEEVSTRSAWTLEQIMPQRKAV